jgi:putative membrane protein
MDAPITAHSFLNFLAYAGIGIGVLVAAAVAVLLITPHRELSLIREGNTAAATAFSGTLIGLALPLHSAISNSVSLIDAAIWGAVSVIVQLFAFLLARLVAPKLSQQITLNQTAAGIFSAGVSVSVGLINAAAMTP